MNETCIKHALNMPDIGGCPYCEIDRLKAELEEASTIANDNYQVILKCNAQINDYKRQLDASQALLAEARAELSFWRAMDKDLATGESIKDKIRQDVAREIIQYVIDQGQIPTGWNQTMLYEIDDSDIIELKSLFKLEG